MIKMDFIKYIVLVFFLALTLIGFSTCKPSNPFIHTPISGEIVIDNNEREFVFNKPFKPTRQVNEICFEYSENLKIDQITSPPKFADGKPLIITSYLVDQNGEKYETTSITRNGENYICFTPENYVAWLDISKQNISFIKLFAHSNPKINILKIEWKSYNSWDFK